MRKILFLAFAGTAILIGCSKDSGSSASTNITGKWTVNKIVELDYANNVKIDGDTATDGSLVFNNDGTYTETDNISSGTGTYSYNSSTKKLIISNSGDQEIFNVTSLTSSNLHFTFDSSEVDGGVTYRTTLDADLKR